MTRALLNSKIFEIYRGGKISRGVLIFGPSLINQKNYLDMDNGFMRPLMSQVCFDLILK